MARIIRNTGSKVPRIRGPSDGPRKISARQVAAAIGAEATRQGGWQAGGPITLLAIRRELQRRLRSRGGRPSLDKATRRQKIPISEEEWEKLRRLAAKLAEAEVGVTPGQIASLLLHRSLEQIDESDWASTVRTTVSR